MSERSSTGFVEWVLRRKALAATRASRGVEAQAELLRRGTLTRELADRTLDPVEPLRGGSAPFLAIELYRVATSFLLAAAHPGGEARDLRHAWDQSSKELLDSASRGPEGRARIDAIFFGSGVAEDAALPDGEQRRRAEDARDFVHALAKKLEGRDVSVERLLVQRALRIILVGTLLAVIVLGIAGLSLRTRRRHDLAAGKPFKTSSFMQDGDFDPIAHTVERGTVPLLFHTTEEDNPWFEVDLGAVQRVGTIEVKNRADCCLDRAVPLIIEVRADHDEYSEVGRRTETFTIWETTFEPRDVRWVRLRVPRRTYFHLERVSVYAP